jgi:recombination protein RecT
MSNELSIVKKETVDLVVSKVKQFQNSGEVHFPPNYSPENALKSAWLKILDTENKDKKPALEVCTRESVANAMLSMVIQGLNTDKNQGYFIPYGNKLTFQRSYFGTMAVAKRVNPEILDIVAQVVYEPDIFKYRIDPRTGKKEITEHEQTLEAVDSKKIKAAYCLVIDQKEKVIKTEIMTYEQIKQAWKQSKTYPIDDKGNIKTGSTHDKFTAEMCMKTVINKVCKPLINSSDDKSLKIVRKIGQDEESMIDADVSAEIEANANTIPLETIDYSTGEIMEETINTESVLDTSQDAGF